MILEKLRNAWYGLRSKPVNLEEIYHDIKKILPEGIEHSIKVCSFKKFVRVVKRFVFANDDNGNEIITSAGVIFTKNATLLCNPYTNTYPGINRALEIRKGPYSCYWIAAVNGKKAEVIVVQM